MINSWVFKFSYKVSNFIRKNDSLNCFRYFNIIMKIKIGKLIETVSIINVKRDEILYITVPYSLVNKLIIELIEYSKYVSNKNLRIKLYINLFLIH